MEIANIANTSTQHDLFVTASRKIFTDKMKDYGTAWRILRLPSITDQIFIKAQRIRSIEEKGVQKVDDKIENEFKGIINYCIIALIQAELLAEVGGDTREISHDEMISLFKKKAKEAKDLMENKNHDYGEAWRGMRTSSMTDLILMKLLRVKLIEDKKGQTVVREGVEANYMDMVNYSVFALIKLST